MEGNELISRIIAKGFLASPDLSTALKEENIEQFLDFLKNLESRPLFINKEIYEKFIKTVDTSKELGVNAAILQEPDSDEFAEPAQVTVIRPTEKRESSESKVKIKKNYISINKKIDINDWVAYYFDRYNKLRDVLQNREELKSTIAIGRAQKLDGRQNVALIGMVRDIHKTMRGMYFVVLEDPTGTIKICFKSPECIRKAEEIVFDEVIGVIGTKSGELLYAENVIFPEIPERPIKKAEQEVYAAFISDIHVGSNMFLPKEFSQFIDWTKGDVGNEKQREIAKKVKYLFVTGDLVDGVGIYPGQENELLIPDIYAQYNEFAKYISQVPEDIQIIICPGNHDALRMEEPQPALFKDITKPIYDLSNVTMVSNPALVNIHNIGNFPGIDVMMYHGYSFDHYVSDVPALRKYGYDNIDKVQEFLLRKRHLSPSHGSTLIHPAAQDFLVIDKLPDVLVTGHIHKAKIGRYKNIATVSSSCFQDRTAFQEKIGHHPEPGRIPMLNLKTNELKILRFK